MKLRRSLFFVLIPLILLVALFAVSNSYFRGQEVARAEGRLSLYQSTVEAELNRFSHLTYVLASDPFVMAVANGSDPSVLNPRLEAFAARAGLDAIYLMTPTGTTIAASNHAETRSFIGQNYAFRPYFQTAARGGQGRFYGIGATTGLPGYFIADPVLGVGGAIDGVIAIKVDLERLEQSWRGSDEQVLLVNRDGVVLLASDPGRRYLALSPLDSAQRDRIASARQFSGQPLDPLEWRITGNRRAVVGGQSLTHLSTDQLPHGWVLHYFGSETPITTRSWLVVVGAAALMALFMIITQLRKTRKIGAALRRSEAEEAELRQANARLAVEIDDRKQAERRLKRTRGELERASRLAALGQLAASVTHELGQPIAAMRNHLAAAEIKGDTSASTMGRLAGLVERMEGTTRQLKFFANPSDPALVSVDLRDATTEAVALVAPNIEAAGVNLNKDLGPGPIFVQGNKLRIEQVLTNILRNAVDATQDSDAKDVTVKTGSAAGMGWVEVLDTGLGLGGAILDDLREPFVTSRASGQGMGLGLAISSGIVSEHNGRLTAEDRKEGGAVFRVEIPLAEDDEDTT